MKKLAFVALAMFVLVFALGCTGGEKDTAPKGTSSGPGWTMTVNPIDVVEGGFVTIDLRIENIFEEDMNKVSVDFKDVPQTYMTGSYGNIEESDGVSILPGQQYPVIMQLDAKQSGTISGRSIEVCFDYDTEYSFDVGLKTKEDAAEVLSTESSVSDGPLSLAVVGLDNIFYNNSKGTGSMTLDNNWQGEIREFETISAIFPVGSYITNGTLSISNCKDSTTTATEPAELKSSDTTNCKILSTGVAIENGLTLRTEIGVNKQQTALTVERVVGNVLYNYCYEIPLPTISINEV